MTRIRIGDKEAYKAYLKSPHWQAIRKRLYRAYEYKCAMCGSSRNLNVHHITYENLGEEKDEDLTVLCQRCHETLHDDKYTFFDDLCLAWDRLFDAAEAETDETEKGIIEVQMRIVDRAMGLVANAREIYTREQAKKKGKS